MECESPNTSLHDPFQNNDITINKNISSAVSFIQPETVNESNEITNICHGTDMGQQIVHEERLAISIPSGDYLTISKNTSSSRVQSSKMENILLHNTSNHSKEVITAPPMLFKENTPQGKNIPF